MSTKTRNDCPKILRSQERPPRLLEGHSGDSCRGTTFNPHRGLKFGIWLLQCYLEHSSCQRTYLTPVRNHRRPLRLLGGRFGDTFWRSNTCNAHRDLKFGIWLLQCMSRTFLMSKNLFDTSQEPQTSS